MLKRSYWGFKRVRSPVRLLVMLTAVSLTKNWIVEKPVAVAAASGELARGDRILSRVIKGV